MTPEEIALRADLDAEDMQDLHQMLRQYRNGRTIWKAIMISGACIGGFITVFYAFLQIIQFFRLKAWF